MPRAVDLLKRHLLAGIADRQPFLEDAMPGPAELARSERSPEFERLRMNRKILGALRYGRMGAPGKPQFDRARDMLRRLQLYLEDQNKEHLVDVANLCELEFTEGAGHLKPGDDGQHTEAL